MQAQNPASKSFAFSAGYHRGFLIAHRPTIVPLQQDHLNGLEVNLIKQTNGKKQWHQIYNYPQIGISMAYWDLGNKKQLGFGLTAIPYIDFPISKGTKHAFDLKFGWGIGYVEKIFDEDINYKNIAIGSHLNCGLLLQPHYRYQISNNIALGAGLSLTHFSNGSIVTPNLGLNLASATGNIVYSFGKKQEIIHTELPPFIKSSRFTLFGSGSIKQVYPANGKNYFACTLSGNYTRQKTAKSGIGFGGDIFYDNSIYQKLEERNLTLNNSFEALKCGFHGSYELVITDFSFMISMGAYVYTKLKNDGYIYHRIALRYQFSKKMFACVNLKAHWGKADYLEWGIGYRIDYNKNHE